MGHKLQTNLY
uniref:Uncharacterized protein n=1 Tax=Rhizophora mucronata TaxID=61149 RepID=A0A2P2R0X1_RHIMU